MIQAVGGADFVLLVTEPTPFGLNDLKLAVETIRELTYPAVAINRSTIGNNKVGITVTRKKYLLSWKYPRTEKLPKPTPKEIFFRPLAPL